ncbi:P1 family peptidase [Halalkalibacter alkalisediminis]|uniref:P1 family peptidase n=1 Tax=Halalkalibacter alkalisediminis TaxID=935616 RepID=A0ABV6NG64_9BACI
MKIGHYPTGKDEVEEGCVGAGTGMSCLGFKGGIGTSSRMTNINGVPYTLGVLVLSNYGQKEDIYFPDSIKFYILILVQRNCQMGLMIER